MAQRSLTGDLLRILAGSAANSLFGALGEAITTPMKTKSQAKLYSAKSLLENLPMMSQDDAGATAGILNKIAGTQVVPTRMAETGNVVSPTGETLAMTPVPGAPVTPELKERFVTGTPTLEQLKANAFASMTSDEQKRTMKAIETMGQVAALENAKTARDRYNAMYAPGGVEWQKVGIAREKLPIAQQTADATSLNAVTNVGNLDNSRARTKLDATKLEQVEIPGFESLKKYREDSISLEKNAQAQKTAKDKLDTALKMLEHGNDYLKTYKSMDESIRAKNLKKPADLDGHMADAEAVRSKAVKLISEGFSQLSPSEQKQYKDQVKQTMIPALIENARKGHAPTQKKLKEMGVSWE